ncbi:FtsH protease activity modulator HflK [Candidatus Poribacteria bacterium]
MPEQPWEGMKQPSWDGMKPYLRFVTPKFIIIVILIIFLLATLATGFYTVAADEVAVVLRFGKYVKQTESGLHFKLPLGIEKAITVPVKKLFKEEFGFRTLQAGIRTQYDTRDYPGESLLLTGDLNIADVEWVIQYKIKNPREFLFSIRDPKQALRDLSEAVMSTVVGDRSVTEVLTTGRNEIVGKVEELLQKLLDEYQTGLDVTSVTLQDVNPPESVKPAFNAVNEARQEKERSINEAKTDYNQAIPKAEGMALQLVSEAEGYATKRENEARGDANRFDAIRKEYQDAKDVTRRRLYLETMSEILPAAKEIYVIDGQSNTPIPILQLK